MGTGDFKYNPKFNTLIILVISSWSVLQKPVYAMNLLPWYIWCCLTVLCVLYIVTQFKAFESLEYNFWQGPKWQTALLSIAPGVIFFRIISIFFSTDWATVTGFQTTGTIAHNVPELWILFSAAALALIGTLGIYRTIVIWRNRPALKSHS